MRIRRAARTLLALACLAVPAAVAPAAGAQPPPKAAGHDGKASHGHPKPAPVKANAKLPAGKAAAPAKPKKGGGKQHVATRRAGEAGEPDEATRRIIAGTS